MNYKEVQKRLDAAQRIVNASSTTPDKIRSLATLLSGINPNLDAALKEVNRSFATLEKMEKMEIITLTVEAIPEITEKDKRRKKFLLLFLKSWHDLQKETVRVEAELKELDKHPHDQGAQMNALGNVFGMAKGPLGIVTVVAVAAVAVQMLSVTVTIKNEGCDPISPVSKFPIILPGIRLPNEPIPSGGSATATLPPVSLTVDGTQRGTIVLSGLGQNYIFELSDPSMNFLYNGASLLGTQTEIKLSRSTPQEFVVRCR